MGPVCLACGLRSGDGSKGDPSDQWHLDKRRSDATPEARKTFMSAKAVNVRSGRGVRKDGNATRNS